jgi:phage baseplate assembly protein V
MSGVHPNHLWRRVVNASAPGVVSQVDDTATIATLRLSVGYQEIMDKKPLLQQYGFSSVPPDGSDALAIFLSGDRSNGVVVGTNDQKSRPTGRAPGAVTLYDASGNSVALSKEHGIVVTGNGNQPITVNSAGQPIAINAGAANVNVTAANLTVTGNVEAAGAVIANYQSAQPQVLGEATIHTGGGMGIDGGSF